MTLGRFLIVPLDGEGEPMVAMFHSIKQEMGHEQWRTRGMRVTFEGEAFPDEPLPDFGSEMGELLRTMRAARRLRGQK
jgi:hypothetical protein